MLSANSLLVLCCIDHCTVVAPFPRSPSKRFMLWWSGGLRWCVELGDRGAITLKAELASSLTRSQVKIESQETSICLHIFYGDNTKKIEAQISLYERHDIKISQFNSNNDNNSYNRIKNKKTCSAWCQLNENILVFACRKLEHLQQSCDEKMISRRTDRPTVWHREKQYLPRVPWPP